MSQARDVADVAPEEALAALRLPEQVTDLDSVVVTSYSGVKKVEREAFTVTSISTKELKNTAEC